MSDGKIIAIILILGGSSLYLFFFISDLISDRRERKRKDKFARKEGPKVLELLNMAIEINAPKLENDITSMKKEINRSNTILKDGDGYAINICPKCKGTLAIKNTYSQGPVIACSNYPKCSGYIKKIDSIYNLDFNNFSTGLDNETT